MRLTDKWRRKLHKAGFLYRCGGLGGLAFCAAYRLLRGALGLRVLHAVKVDCENLIPGHLNQLKGYRFGYCSPEELLRWTNDPELELEQAFLERAAVRGDRCFAIFEGDKLVNYCWTSTIPTPIDNGLLLEYPRDYLYRYREYTRVSHRGRRLSSFSTAEALSLMEGGGRKGFVGYVEADNLVSATTLKRKKHDFIGRIVMLGPASRPWIWHSPSARAAGFRVRVPADALPVRHRRASYSVRVKSSTSAPGSVAPASERR